MSSKSRFTWIRAIPNVFGTTNPDYYRFNLKNMRQIPTLLGNATSNGINSAMITSFVPANSWGFNKLLMIRGWYQMTVHAPGPGVPVNIREFVTTVAGGAVALPTSPAITPAIGQFTTFIERAVIRIGNFLYAFDYGDVAQFNWANKYNGVQHVIAMLPVGPPYDFAAAIDIKLEFNIPVLPSVIDMNCVWAESFLEQATNLGKLP